MSAPITAHNGVALGNEVSREFNLLTVALNENTGPPSIRRVHRKIRIGHLRNTMESKQSGPGNTTGYRERVLLRICWLFRKPLSAGDGGI